MNKAYGQISIDELIQAEKEQASEMVTLLPVTDSETVYTIPCDVWEKRCSLCVHRNAVENIPVPLSAVHRQQYSELIPCRIMAVSRPNDIPGECRSFAPRMDTYGICRTCVYTSHFHEGYCMKENHAPAQRVYIGQDWGQEYYRQSLNVCDDYEPDMFVKEGKF